MTTNFRRFDFKDGNIIMTPEKGGEFVHINDIELYLRKQQWLLENMKAARNKSDTPTEWDVRYEYGIDEQIRLINNMLDVL